jgi:N-acetylglucosamine kinase
MHMVRWKKLGRVPTPLHSWSEFCRSTPQVSSGDMRSGCYLARRGLRCTNRHCRRREHSLPKWPPDRFGSDERTRHTGRKSSMMRMPLPSQKLLRDRQLAKRLSLPSFLAQESAVAWFTRAGLFRGRGGIAGEWGHGPVVDPTAGGTISGIPHFQCGCGQTGCPGCLRFRHEV